MIIAVTVKDFLERFKADHPKDEEEVAVAVWTVKNVKSRAEELHIDMTDERAQKIVASMHNHHDPSIGLTWGTPLTLILLILKFPNLLFFSTLKKIRFSGYRIFPSRKTLLCIKL